MAPPIRKAAKKSSHTPAAAKVHATVAWRYNDLAERTVPRARRTPADGGATLNSPLLLSLGMLALLTLGDAADRTPLEHVTKRPVQRDQGLGTCAYSPSEAERPFFNKLADNEKTTGAHKEGYDLSAPGRTYIGWFGIVRAVREDAAHGQTLLTVEHKYFDGLTDSHIQALSFNGGGDFQAALRGTGHEISPLSLVKVYGTRAQALSAGLPRVDAVFVRNWHWGTFTFLAAWGTQKGSTEWRRANQVDLEQIYDPYPRRSYYEERLGKRGPDDPLYRRLVKPAGKLSPQSKSLMIELIDSLDVENLFPVIRMVGTIRSRHEERAAVAVLLAAIQEEEIPSWSASYALGQLGGRSELPALRGLLRDASPEIRARAADALYEMGKTAAPAVPDLVRALRDPKPPVRLIAARALGAVGRQAQVATGPLRAALKDSDASVRVASATSLWYITLTSEPAITALIAALQDPDKDVRWSAAQSLEWMGADAKGAGPALIVALRDKDQSVRYAAATALGWIRPDANVALPALRAQLKDDDSYVRAVAADAIGRYGKAAAGVVPALVAALKDENDYVRRESAAALGQIGSDAAKAIPPLIDILQHPGDPNTRWFVAEALGAIDTQGREAIPALTHALTDESANVRHGAAIALGAIGRNAKAALPALQSVVQGKDATMRVAAAATIWKITGDAKAAMPILQRTLDDAQSPDLFLAVSAVQDIGPAAKAAVPSLTVLLRHKDPRLRARAAEALGSIGPPAAAAAASLAEAIRPSDGYRAERLAAAEALWHINRHPRAIPVLIDLLKSDADAASAAEALGRIGPAAREAIPALEDALKDSSSYLRPSAAEALRKIREP
jgi:HEAT repeat protein